MPPPPPPSKSYLLVFDTDSEEEEEESYYPRPSPPRPVRDQSIAESALRIQEPAEAGTTTAMANSSRCRRPHVVEDDEDDDDDDSAENCKEKSTTTEEEEPKKLTKSQKKNRARRKKKKSKRSSGTESSTTTAAATTCSKSNQKKVSFSSVSIRSFERCFSADTVPLDGGWPLGSDLDKFEDGEAMLLEDFESLRQEHLRHRWELIRDGGKIDENISKRMTERPAGVPCVLETRQWDYLSGTKNPLFRPLVEEERQELLLQCSSENDTSTDSMLCYGGPPSPCSKRRTRSNSVSSMSDMSIGSTGSSSSPSKRRSRSNSMSTQFNETYNQVYVHHVRNELEQLRNDRSKSGATGCNCRKLSVYLPPKDGSGGKKAQHRRMKPSKVAAELKKRGLYDPKASREALEKSLHDAVEKEPCCIGNDCFCARNGIDCQADACSCWHDSHVHSKSGTKGGVLSIQQIQGRCGNPLGMAVVDLTAIDNFRSKLLASGVCQPVGGAMSL